ncbi:MAG: Holliday junction branch migration protein RuvA [Dehalococcoidia bacterium]|nr:Holliday junction branch migration protein RuvA [Dehalococcoidia bacterium]
MIVALRGRLVHWDADRGALWLEVAGVTYELALPPFAAEWVAAYAPGDELALFTYQHASERQPVPLLFGFPRLGEREFFRKFIEVPTIGPAKAVRALTRPVSEVARWVESEDTRALQQLPGIGERLAQTIVARLRGRLVDETRLVDEGVPPGAAGSPPDVRADAVEALVALQYNRREAEQVVNEAVRGNPALDTVESVLRFVLERQVRAG